MNKKPSILKTCPGYVDNFKALQEAIVNGDAGLMECTDKVTQKKVAVICAIFKDETGYVNMVPFAKMFDGNPYEELEPPM